MEGGAEWRHCSSVAILPEVGTQCIMADKLHSTCQPREIEDVPVNQQLWQNIFLQMKLLYYSPILILTGASIPTIPNSKVPPLLTRCVLYILLITSLTEK